MTVNRNREEQEEKMGHRRRRIPDPVDCYVGARIRERRQAAGLTQAELAATLGVGEQQMRRFERGSNRLSPRQILALSHRLQVGPGYFLEGALQPEQGANGGGEVIEMIESFRAIRNDGMRRDLFLLVQAAARRSFTRERRA